MKRPRLLVWTPLEADCYGGRGEGGALSRDGGCGLHPAQIRAGTTHGEREHRFTVTSDEVPLTFPLTRTMACCVATSGVKFSYRTVAYACEWEPARAAQESGRQVTPHPINHHTRDQQEPRTR